MISTSLKAQGGWRRARSWWAAAVQILTYACAAMPLIGAHANEPLRDDLGRVVDVEKVPERIVSILPSLTETVCVLGACDRLVGVDRYSNWPPATMAQLPVVGGGIDPNIEAIVALRPDLVLMSGSQRIAQRLEALGIRSLALEPRTQTDVHRVLRTLGAVLQQPITAEHEWQRIERGVQQVTKKLSPNVRGQKVYFEVNRGPYAAGPQSFIGELLNRMGVENIVPAHLGPFPRLNPEWVVRHPPDVILLGSHSMLPGSIPPGWAQLPAIQHNRVCRFTDAEADIIVRPGPRMVEAAQLMADCLIEKTAHHAN